MGFLATSTNLGTLEVLEIYVQYNGPRLLACKNQASQIFLSLWVDEEEDSDLWIYMLVSHDRLQSIRTGEISLHQAFCMSESLYLYELTYTHADSRWATKKTSVEDIDRDYFPLEDTFLTCSPETLPNIECQKTIKNAITKNREITYLILQPSSNNYPNEFPAFELGNILSTFQPLINHLVPNTNKDIQKKLELNVFATSAGSFQIELASSFFEVDMFGNSIVGDAIEKLFQLIMIESNADNLRDFMLQADKKTAIKYRYFLEALIKSGSGIKIEWGSPTLTRGGSVQVSLSSIGKTLEVMKKIESLETSELEIIGELFKADKVGWKFGIKDIKTDFNYKGDILDQAKRDAGVATISNYYTAKILVVPEITPATDDINTHYKLLSLSPYEVTNEQLKLID